MKTSDKEPLTPAAEYCKWLGLEIVNVDLHMLADAVAEMLAAVLAVDEGQILAIEMPDGLPFLAKLEARPFEPAAMIGFGLVQYWLRSYVDLRAKFMHMQDLLRTKGDIHAGCQQLATISREIEQWLASGIPGPNRVM
jgi:hypothetical protein